MTRPQRINMARMIAESCRQDKELLKEGKQTTEAALVSILENTTKLAILLAEEMGVTQFLENS